MMQVSRQLVVHAVLLSVVAAALTVSTVAGAQSVRTEIVGISDELLGNVQASLALKQAEQLEQISIWRLRQMSLDAREEVQRALQPFGYYAANVNVRLLEPDRPDAPWLARIEVSPGEPVRVQQLQLDLGVLPEEIEVFADWLAAWPLPKGAVLRHPPYTQALAELQGLAERHGFFEATFAQRVIEVDPVRGEAAIRVDYRSGLRYRIGMIDFGEAGFNEDLMQALTTLESEQPYLSGDIDRQREVLVRTGYFQSVVIQQQRVAETDTVEIDYQVERRPPNTYRVLAGFGTDTGARIQLGWTRHYLSDRGDRLDTRFGAQQTNSEFVLRSNYQHPFGGEPGNFLFADLLLRRENDRFRFEDENRIEPVFEAFPGNREQAQITVGRLRERMLFERPFEPLRERLFLTFLNERFDAFPDGSSVNLEQAAVIANNPGLARFLDTDTNTVAAGAELQLVRLEGDRFDTRGLYAQLRVLGSVEALGSATSFLQGYAEGRWHWRFGTNQKLMLRGQLGYTEANTERFTVSIPGDPRELNLEITELPELFRFKTGGDRTVRGYGFEELSTNRNGANHILVGSVEYEYRVFGDFSVAAFYDVGNAFNDFANVKLKRGVGGGLRWYSIIGPVQLDLAKPLDDDGIRIHFTIGTKLL